MSENKKQGPEELLKEAQELELKIAKQKKLDDIAEKVCLFSFFAILVQLYVMLIQAAQISSISEEISATKDKEIKLAQKFEQVLFPEDIYTESSIYEDDEDGTGTGTSFKITVF